MLVGRDAELVQLHNLLEKALTGERQLGFISGEAGIGKTTLVDAFLLGIRDRELGVSKVWLGRGQCLERQGEGEAYLPVLEALGQLCQGPRGGDVLTALRRYAPTWLLHLSGLIEPAEREQLQREGAGATSGRMLREMAEALEAMSAEHGLVLVLEDLHVSDPSTIELLAYLAQRRTPARLLIIGVYRPVEVAVTDHPLRGRVQELLMRGLGVRVALELFTEAEVEAYLQQRPSTSTLPSMLAHQVWRQTDGNPLFLVHTVEYLLERRILMREAGQWQVRGELSTSAIPDTLQHLLRKQLDDLSSEQQRLLEAASVVGVVFPVASVAAGLQTTLETLEDACEELARRGVFLEDRGVTTWPDGTLTGQFGFRHALYREAFYQRVGSVRKIRLHRAIGLREETGYAERAGEHATELVQHFEQGQELARSIHYLLAAGQNALRKAGSAEALGLFSRAMTLLAAQPDTPSRRRQEVELQLGLATASMIAKGFTAPEFEQALARAQTLCRQLGETLDLLPVLAGLWAFSFTRGEQRTSRPLAEQLLRLAQQTADPAWLGVAQANMQVTLYLQGELARARQHGEQALAQFAVALSIPTFFNYTLDPRVRARGYAAATLHALGYLDQARQQSLTTLRVARELGPTQTIGSMLYLVANLHGGSHEWVQMQVYAAELINLAMAYDLTFWWALGTCAHGIALTQQGKLAEGIEQTQQGLALYRTSGARAGITRILCWLAEAYGRAGQFAQGFPTLEEAFTMVEQHDERLWEAELYRLKGELLLNAECRMMNDEQKGKTEERAPVVIHHSSFSVHHSEEAETCFLKAVEIARRQEAKLFELRATTSLARLWRRQGKNQEAHQQLAEIYGWFTEGFDTKDLQDARALLKALRD